MRKSRIVGALSLAFGFALLFSAALGQNTPADAAADSVVTIFLAADGQSHAVGSGMVVRSDGYVLVPLSIVRGAREIQIRLRNGETYDKAEIVTTDERRNVALLRVNASGLRVIPFGTTEEAQVGSRVFVVSNPAGKSLVKNTSTLNSVQMADTIAGAGKGYRVLQFGPVDGASNAGGLVLDELGRSLGIITTTPDVKGQEIAVPMSSVVGLIRSVSNNGQPVVSTVSGTGYPAAPSQTPYPIPQSSVAVPERGVVPLMAKGPGSVVVKPKTVPEILAASKTIYVTSRTISFKPDQMINALNKRKEISEWGLTFVDEQEVADLILELDHVLFTWKYTFKLYSQRLGTVVATGDRIIWDGNLGADDMAKRVIEKLKIARGDIAKTSTEKEKKKSDKESEKKKDS